MNFLRDWLHLWHERRYKSRKDISDMDKSDMRDVDDDYKCSCSDYDSEDINEEDSLQNVLLITGPILGCAHMKTPIYKIQIAPKAFRW